MNKEAYLNATKIGRELGLTAQKVNKLLDEAGLSEGKGLERRLTKRGEPFGRVVDAVDMGGRPYVQLVWLPEVVDELSAFLKTQTSRGIPAPRPSELVEMAALLSEARELVHSLKGLVG